MNASLKWMGFGALVAAALVAPGTAWSAGETRTRSVDCSKGKSIQDLLDGESASEVIVEISGICYEDVVIRRDNVTLRGTNPAVDGLRGVADGTHSRDAIVFITNAQHIRIENLSIAEGARNGIMTEQGDAVVIVDSEIFDNGRDGLQFDADSSVTVENTSFTDNARAAIASFGGEIVFCTDCTISGSRFGLLLINGVRAVFTNGSIDVSEIAVLADPFTTAFIEDAAIASPSIAIYAGASSEVNTFGGSVEGPVFGENGGRVNLDGTTQTSNTPGYNIFRRSAALTLNNGSELLGYTEVADFSSAVVTSGSALDGSFNCLRGGDAVCSDPLVDVTGSSNCSQCPKP